MLENAKENSSLLAQARQSDGKLPMGLLMKNKEEIKDDIEHFIKLKKLDQQNEKFPKAAYDRR